MTFVRTRLGYWTYKADYAQSNYDNRKKCKNKYVKFTEQIKVFVREKIKEDWSPDQICGYADMRICGYADMRICKNKHYVSFKP
jgi:IS30 family transposase